MAVPTIITTITFLRIKMGPSAHAFIVSLNLLGKASYFLHLPRKILVSGAGAV
jgi:hypothetical protein